MAVCYQWDSSCSVNVKQCDAHHQRLFSLINALHEAMLAGKGSQVVDRVVVELENYTKYHFTAEEDLMEKTGYPELAAHRVEHQRFVEKVQQFREQLKEGNDGRAIDVSSFMNEWLQKHIKLTDQRYSAHLNANGVV